MKKIRLDVAQLERAFETREGEAENILDTATGEIITLRFAQMWDDDIRKIRVRVGADTTGRYLAIPPLDARVAIRDMADFLKTVTDSRLHRALDNALKGRRALREFKEVLLLNTPERTRWYAFKDARLRERVSQWLVEKGIEVVEE